VARRRPGRGSAPLRGGRSSVLCVIALALVLALAVRTFVIQTFYIPSGSMEPTLNVGDRILVFKLAYDFSSPRDRRRDCVQGTTHGALRRSIGDRSREAASWGSLARRSGRSATTIILNGKPLRQDWPHYRLLLTPITRQKIAPNHYFMMGDNHPESCDSRDLGQRSPRDRTSSGKVVLKIWPLSQFGTDLTVRVAGALVSTDAVLGLSPVRLRSSLSSRSSCSGPDKLPQVAKQAGALWHTLRSLQQRVEDEIREVAPDLPRSSDLVRYARSPVTLAQTSSPTRPKAEVIGDTADAPGEPAPTEFSVDDAAARGEGPRAATARVRATPPSTDGAAPKPAARAATES